MLVSYQLSWEKSPPPVSSCRVSQPPLARCRAPCLSTTCSIVISSALAVVGIESTTGRAIWNRVRTRRPVERNGRLEAPEISGAAATSLVGQRGIERTGCCGRRADCASARSRNFWSRVRNRRPVERNGRGATPEISGAAPSLVGRVPSVQDSAH